MLYSQNFYAQESDFWREDGPDSTEQNQQHDLSNVRVNRTAYQLLRERYHAEGRLVDLYSKVGDAGPRVEASREGWRYWLWKTFVKLV